MERAAVVFLGTILGFALLYISTIWNNPILPALALVIVPFFFATLILKPEVAILFLAVLGSSLETIVVESTTLSIGEQSINFLGSLNVLLVLGGTAHLLSHKVKILNFRLSRYFLFFLAICICAALIAPDRIVALRDCTRLTAYFIIYLLT